MQTIGVVAGSFDPITNGHLFVIKEALKMVDKLYVLVANNPAKKHLLPVAVRKTLVDSATGSAHWSDLRGCYRTTTGLLPDREFTAQVAKELSAEFIFRGIRNVIDFEYENAQRLINLKIAPDVTTVFLMPPAELVSVSSSALRSMIGMKDWEQVAEGWLPDSVITHLRNMQQHGDL